MRGDFHQMRGACGSGAFIEAFIQGLVAVFDLAIRCIHSSWIRICAVGDKSVRFIWWCPFFGSFFWASKKMNELLCMIEPPESGAYVLFCAAKKEPKKAAHQIKSTLLSPATRSQIQGHTEKKHQSELLPPVPGKTLR